MLAAHLNAELPGMLRLGPIRLPAFALFATGGLIAALALSQRTARRVGLDPDRLWDAGIVAVAAAFLVSRILLVAENWRIFTVVPTLVLALPSLTYTGMLLTALLLVVYLRWKRIPWLAALDAWAPCAALLAVFLELGHFFEGTAAGMPTAMPWGVVAPGDTVLGRTEPVQLFAAAVALALCCALYAALARGFATGTVAGWALLAGGASSFLLDMLRQPVAQESPLPLDPSQLAAVVAALAGVALLFSGPWALSPGPSPQKEPRHAQ